jgi:pyruvate dehydrogenase E1 component alpha subunit
VELDKKTQAGLYETMLTIRRFEEHVAREVFDGHIVGFAHSYIGQEAVAAGVCRHLTVKDKIVSNHRGHGHCIAKGADVNRMMAEIYGKKDGCCKGKGGSMHIADFGVGMLGADGIVGAGLPISTGAALAAKLEGKKNVAVVFFGDGACNEGEFHESLNLAGIWKLPLLFVCENNGYGVNTPASYAMAAGDITRIPEAYHIANATVEGNDVEAVYEAAGAAIERLRRGEGPCFLECKTYRWHTHFLSKDIEDLRPKGEIAAWKERCPVATYADKLLRRGTLAPARLQSLQAKVQKKIDDAFAFAAASPYPKPEDALADVYSA